MPRPPRCAPSVAQMSGAVFSPIAARLQSGVDVVPLHVGDTWLEPFPGGRMEDLRQADYPVRHRETETVGLPELVDAIVEKVRTRNEIACERDAVLVTGGATGGLAAAVGMLAAPGEEILVFGSAQDWKLP